ncbi:MULTISPECIES: sulfotransferase family protein [Nocardioides]|uniref:Sulfotransferase family protein n=1 Tax=Nocardioides vastitatis TaxID=2568655 RepID=A0ABW0ZBW6_9ACTN|nr:sulfotransferase [Nocardioides sp.]THJ02309.1 sulfotransferase domain-containing protein [Nocardioides sp.]
MAQMPNLFIVGAGKAGTTAMHSLLSMHPKISMSTLKEPHYYSSVQPDPALRHLIPTITDKADYLALFRDVDAPIRGEASPSYLFDPAAAHRIRADVPGAKILILLRDPVQRAFSHYLMDVREGLETRPFLEAVAADDARTDRRWGTACHLYIDLGLYAAQVGRYLEVFPRENILVLESAQLQEQMPSLLDALAHFLEVDVGSFQGVPAATNAFARPRSDVSRRIMRSQRIRISARRLVPAKSRLAVRDRILLTTSQRPTLDNASRIALQPRFEADITETRKLLSHPLSTLTSSWV